MSEAIGFYVSTLLRLLPVHHISKRRLMEVPWTGGTGITDAIAWYTHMPLRRHDMITRLGIILKLITRNKRIETLETKSLQ